MSAEAAVRREGGALGRLGAQVFEALRPADVAELPETARAAHTALRDANALVASHAGAADASLAADRRDFADAGQLTRWAVIARGVLDRFVQRRREERDEDARLAREIEFGRIALDGGDAGLRALVPATAVTEVEAARRDAQAAREERAKLLAPFDGQALPAWLAAVLRETRAFVSFVWREFSKKLFVRAPAVAGLIAGWWIARTYTGSTHGTVFANLGLSDKKPVDASTFKQMEFWLPLIAAALCSYASWAIARRVQNKYAPRATNDAQ